MFLNIILLFLFAGVPYYIFFEKTKVLKNDKIFLVSAALFLGGIVLASLYPQERSNSLVVISLITSVFSIYKATKTSNFYKVSYYMLFINAPVFMMFDLKHSIPYSVSLLITLFGIYFIGKYYERNYKSANYYSISGVTIATPYAGIALTIYIITLALYPPFPNAILFIGNILASEINTLWYITVVVIFFGNFFIAMRIMTKTLFGKPNVTIHYVDFSSKDKFIHFLILVTLAIFSVWGFQEVIQ